MRTFALASTLSCAMMLPGCALVKLNRENREYAAATVLVGRVLPSDVWRGPVTVAAIRRLDGKPVIEHEVWLQQPGGFELIVKDGDYRLVAYGDRDNDGRPDADAPAGSSADIKVARAGLILNLDIPLDRGAAAAVTAALPTAHHRAARPDSAPGALADLDDPRFSSAAGKRGYWAPLETFRAGGGNIYFLEPFDPARTPVLFVHGAVGSAQDWRYFVEHLDRARYQPWIFQYPSGAPLEAISHLLYWKLLNLRFRHGFRQLDLVAHSMGGLVARRFLLDHAADFPEIKQFISISTPWGGQPMAARGVNQSPAVIPCWRDLQPEGEFLQSLFARPLPDGIRHTLLFGQHGGSGVLRDASDGTISVESQLRPGARDGAALVMGFEATHAGILRLPEVVSEVERVFAAAQTEPAAAGGIRVVLQRPDGARSAMRTSTLVMQRMDGDPARHAELLRILIAPSGEGAEVESLEPGDYQARVATEQFRARPDRQRVRIEAGKRTEVHFDLEPEGMILGRVVKQVSRIERTPGSSERAGDAIRVESIHLEGATAHRVLKPRLETRGSILEALLDGRDDASNQGFCFVRLPAGEYALTVTARGYETSVSRYTVVPGQMTPFPPIVMHRAASASRGGL